MIGNDKFFDGNEDPTRVWIAWIKAIDAGASITFVPADDDTTDYEAIAAEDAAGINDDVSYRGWEFFDTSTF